MRATSVLREAVFLHERLVPSGLLERVQVLALQVFNERELHDLAFGKIAHHGGHFLHAGHAGGAPAPFPGHDLVAAADQRPHQQRLQHAVLGNGLGQLGEGSVVEVLARLRAVRLNLVDVDRNGSVAVLHVVFRKNGVQAFAQPRPFLPPSNLPFPLPGVVQPRRRISSARLL